MSTQPNSEQSTIPALRQIYFYLTEGCNLACRHCWVAPKFDAQGDNKVFIPVELFEAAIREAKPLGLDSVKLTGGEPLMHPQLSKLLDVLRREEVNLTIETNGLLCTPSIAADIAKSTKRFVAVSIDGADASTHEWIRGVSGSFKKAKQAVRNLVDAGIRTQVIFSIMRHNVDQVEAILRLAESLGAESVKFNVVQPTARGEKLHVAEETLSIGELIRLGRHVETGLAPATKMHVFFSYPLAFRSLSHIADGDSCACNILNIIGVIPNGQWALCGIGQHVQDLVFGTVEKDSLEEVWRTNSTLNILRTGLPTQLEGVCSRCLMKQYCLGSCIAQNFYRVNSLWAPFWFCEQAEVEGLFPSSRLRNKEENMVSTT